MAYKSFLTLATEPDRSAAAVTAAAALCQAADGHLDVLALGVDRSQVGYSYVGTGTMVLQVAMERAEEEARANEKAAKSLLRTQSATLRYGVDSAVTHLGALTDVVASRARYADLVVLPKPYAETSGPEAEAVVEAALFDGMAPVLVVPQSGLRAVEPKRIVLAWNQSREALVATRRALPFLKAADHVTVVVIDPPKHGSERSDPGGLLCQLLVRHGVKAEVSVMARTLPRVSDVLNRVCRDTGADLLVMGAYGHSRLREAILGGSTRNMLEQAEIPVFMAH